jgi:hypothetical protein
MAMANAILDDVRDKSRDAITESITSLDEDDVSSEFTASPLSELQSIRNRPSNPPSEIL